jgi:hypothetical protein
LDPLGDCVPLKGTPVGFSIADARLIAAAPDLLKALEELTAWCRNHTGPAMKNSPHLLLVAAHEAIAKAKGRE